MHQNYSGNKRRREEAKKKKREEKQAKRFSKGADETPQEPAVETPPPASEII